MAAFSRLREPDAGWVLRSKEDGHSAEHLIPAQNRRWELVAPGSACEGRGRRAAPSTPEDATWVVPEAQR